jgi:hypothetical protein
MKSIRFLQNLGQNPTLLSAYDISPEDVESFTEVVLKYANLGYSKSLSLKTNDDHIPNVTVYLEGDAVSIEFSSFSAKADELPLTKAVIDGLNACLEN